MHLNPIESNPFKDEREQSETESPIPLGFESECLTLQWKICSKSGRNVPA